MADAIQGSPEHYKGMYGSLKFPPFKQQEYPKVLYRDEARRQLLGTANNAMEELITRLARERMFFLYFNVSKYA